MESPQDLVVLLNEFYLASANSDTQFLDRLIARGAHTLVIGTDPSEWWAGGDEIVATWTAAWHSRGGMPVVRSAPVAFRDGNIGWVADRAAWRMPDGREVPFRLTAVFRNDGFRWIMVQAHFSVGVPDQ